LLGLYACTSNNTVLDQEPVPKAEVTTQVAVLPLKALDSSSRYITKILTVRDLQLTFDQYANYTLMDMEEAEKQFAETGYRDVEDLEVEEMREVSKNLNADVIAMGSVSESRSGLYNISMRFYSPRSSELKQISFNVGKERTARWKALDEGMMKELDTFVSNEMDKIFNIATNYYNNGNYTAAEQSLKQVVALKPDKLDAYYYLANTYIKLNNNELAEQNFLKAIELDPKDQRSSIALIDLYEKTNQTSKRIALMEQIAEANQDKEIWLAVGNLYDQQGNKTKAKESFQKALTIDPNYSTANVRLAIMLYDEGSFNEAIPLLEKAFDEAPDNEFLSARLATAYQKSGRTQDAITKYENLIKSDPTNANAYLNVVSLYRSIDQNDKAIAAINALKQVDPNNPYVYLNLAAIYLAQGKMNDAETNANLTIAKNASLYQPYVILSAVNQNRGTDAYNSYIDLDRQASKAVGKKATQLKNQRDAAKANAVSLLNKAMNNLQTARNYATDADALNDISARISRINQLLGQLG
jgi:tetratricopeptide (TPR) repeat protein